MTYLDGGSDVTAYTRAGTDRSKGVCVDMADAVRTPPPSAPPARPPSARRLSDPELDNAVTDLWTRCGWGQDTLPDAIDALLGGLSTVWGGLHGDDRDALVSELRGVVTKYARQRHDDGMPRLSRGVFAIARAGKFTQYDARTEHTLQLLDAHRLPGSNYSVRLSDGEHSVVMTTCGSSGVRAAVHVLEGADSHGHTVTRSVRMIVRVKFNVRLVGSSGFVIYRATSIRDAGLSPSEAAYVVGSPVPMAKNLTLSEQDSFQRQLPQVRCTYAYVYTLTFIPPSPPLYTHTEIFTHTYTRPA